MMTTTLGGFAALWFVFFSPLSFLSRHPLPLYLVISERLASIFVFSLHPLYKSKLTDFDS
jgi:hypothetical protein